MALNPAIADWHDRVVWIVGASSGIGRATASQLHAPGAMVVVSARNAAALDAFVADHPGSHAHCRWTSSDRAGAGSRLAAGAGAARGALDLALYCAGHYRAMRATEFDLGEMQLHCR